MVNEMDVKTAKEINVNIESADQYKPSVTAKKAVLDLLISSIAVGAIAALDALVPSLQIAGYLPFWSIPLVSSFSTALGNILKQYIKKS